MFHHFFCINKQTVFLTFYLSLQYFTFPCSHLCHVVMYNTIHLLAQYLIIREAILTRTILFPNYVQYKFNVDGEWRHDEQQPFASGNYGVVNTIYLVREPDVLPAMLSAETPSRSHMEVDNDVFGHAVSLFFLPFSASSFSCSILQCSHLYLKLIMMSSMLLSPSCGQTVHSNTTWLAQYHKFYIGFVEETELPFNVLTFLSKQTGFQDGGSPFALLMLHHHCLQNRAAFIQKPCMPLRSYLYALMLLIFVYIYRYRKTTQE